MKGKVAIITMHRVLNYGSILQTYALSEFIKKYGFDVEIVDYLFPTNYHNSIAYKQSPIEDSISKCRLHINGLITRLLKISILDKRAKFDAFLTQSLKLSRSYMEYSQLVEDPVIADIYITGGDQVWNPRYIGEDKTFFLNWVPKYVNSKLISFSPSFGNSSLPNDFANRIIPELQKFDSISAREPNDILDRINGKHSIVLDPIFLLNKKDWYSKINSKPLVKGRYILCYLLGYSFNPFPYADKLVDYLHRRTGLRVVMIGGEPINWLKGYKLFNDCSPTACLNLFYYSSLVVTTSFHGTAFAINFNKPFLTIVDDQSKHDTRQATIVKSAGADEKCIVTKNTNFDEIHIPVIESRDYPKLEEARIKSQKYLLDAIKIGR